MAQHNITLPIWLYLVNVVEIRLAQVTTEAAVNLDKNKWRPNYSALLWTKTALPNPKSPTQLTMFHFVHIVIDHSKMRIAFSLIQNTIYNFPTYLGNPSKNKNALGTVESTTHNHGTFFPTYNQHTENLPLPFLYLYEAENFKLKHIDWEMRVDC